MNRVIDASVVVAALIDCGPDGTWAEEVLMAGNLCAPHLMPVEVANTLRRAELTGDISRDSAALAHQDLLTLRCELFNYELLADRCLRRIHDDWLEAGAHNQRTVARLSEQMRRFLDDRAWLEIRRIMDLIQDLEQQALAVRDGPPKREQLNLYLGANSPSIELPMARPLFSPPIKPRIDQTAAAFPEFLLKS